MEPNRLAAYLAKQDRKRHEEHLQMASELAKLRTLFNRLLAEALIALSSQADAEAAITDSVHLTNRALASVAKRLQGIEAFLQSTEAALARLTELEQRNEEEFRLHFEEQHSELVRLREELLRELKATAGARRTGQDTSLLEQISSWPDAYDELLASASTLQERYPEDPGVAELAHMFEAGLSGMEEEAVRLLAMRDATFIDSVEKFDPARHRVLGVCARPAGALGDGQVKRRGLVQRDGDRERVVKPALVVLYGDVKV
jgi:hypothetical protein